MSDHGYVVFIYICGTIWAVLYGIVLVVGNRLLALGPVTHQVILPQNP